MDLGSSNHRCLRLVLTDQEYTIIPITQIFMLLNYPDLLNMPKTAIAIEVLKLKD